MVRSLFVTLVVMVVVMVVQETNLSKKNSREGIFHHSVHLCHN